jgi:ATP-dependent DNA helicase RecG
MTFREYLATANLLDDEGTLLELKEAQGGVPKSDWESVSAFANTEGGRILFGVSKDKKVLGLGNAEQIQADVASTIHQVLTPSIQVRLVLLEIEGKRVVEISVPEAEAYLKPVYITARGVRHGGFKRVGSSDIRLNDEDLTRIAAQRSGISPDQQVPAGASLKDIDPALVQRFRTRLQSARPDSPLLGYTDHELLRSLNLTEDGDDGLQPNRAGILLFGKESAILRFFPGFSFKILEIPGTEWVPRPEDRGRILTMPVTGLVEMASQITAELNRRIPEGIYFTSDPLQRQVDPLHVAIREGVVNSLIHQDHLEFQPTQFRRYSDRLEMENPGASKKSPDRFDQPGSSPRNPILARAFNIVGLAEQVGSGILLMKRTFRNAGLAEPEFESDSVSRQFRVRFFWHHFAGADEITWVGRLKNLNEGQKRALLFALRQGRIANEDVRNITGQSAVHASKSLKVLMRTGFLERHGAGNATYYVLSPEAQEDYFQSSLERLIQMLGLEDGGASGNEGKRG